jgi:hypothetical protein
MFSHNKQFGVEFNMYILTIQSIDQFIFSIAKVHY